MRGFRLKRASRILIVLVVIALIIGVAQITQKRIDSIKTDIGEARQLKIIPPGDYLAGSVLGYDMLVADLLWIRAIQYLAKHLDSRDAQWLSQYLNAIVNLDPNYIWVYLKGGITLSFFCDDPEGAIKLLTKGLDRFIYYKIPFYLAFNYFYELGDFEKAAYYMRIASERMINPVRKRHFAELAARLYAATGQTQVTVDFLKMMVKQIKEPKLREELEYKYRVAVNERDLEVIDIAIKKYHTANGFCPESVQILFEDGYLDTLPQDPFDKGYYIQKADCRAATYAVYETLKKVFIIKEEEIDERGN